MVRGQRNRRRLNDSMAAARSPSAPDVAPEIALLARPAAMVVCVVVLGTVGYVVLEGWPFFDALYMVMTTITTVGYGEIRPLSGVGRAFTMLIIVLGAGTMLYTLTTLVQYAVEGDFTRRLRRRRMERQIDRLSGHAILCGYGRVGRQIASEFRREAVPFLVVDVNESSLALAESDGCLTVQGDAATDAVLLAAGVKRARTLVTAVDGDVDNVYVTLSARGLNPSLFIVARASREDAAAKLQRAGADRVISPYQIGGRRMAMLAVRPLAVEFVDTVLHDPSTDLLLEELEIGPESPLVGKPLEAVRQGDEGGLIILAIQQGGRLIPNPPPTLVLQPSDQLVVMGSKHALQGLERRA
jgi:voltage-gated potassium channel